MYIYIVWSLVLKITLNIRWILVHNYYAMIDISFLTNTAIVSASKYCVFLSSRGRESAALHPKVSISLS